LEELVRSAVRGGVTVVQLREKEASTRDFIALARRLKANAARPGGHRRDQRS
jgi:thiamine monophosphate synthase